jgi:hypothetical protein
MDWFKSFARRFTEPLPQSQAGYFPGNFTPRAQQVLGLARKEAGRFNHNFVGTEHVLLGLIKLGQGVAVNVLQKMGLDLETVRMEVEKQVGTGPDQKLIGNIPYTPRVKKVLALASKEAKALNHTYVGTEHILLGLLREGDGVAARVLRNLDVNIEQIRQEILKELDPNFELEDESATQRSTGGRTNASLDPGSANDPASRVRQVPVIDPTQRFDIYCAERNQQVVVYRNALFKGLRRMVPDDCDRLAEFLELEQSNGETVFVAKYSVFKFCEAGITPNAEDVPGMGP